MKIFLDYILILFFLPFIILIIAIITILIILFDGRPVFFTQKRIGKNNKVFKLLKFRTMKVYKLNESYINFESDKKRITKLGNYLRATSLDEIPEILNVLKRDMSLVGPRPLLPEYLKLYNDEQIKRHNVLPGITGLAQINGRNRLNWEDRFKYDLNYVNNHNIFLDIRILFVTFINLFIKKDMKNKDDLVSKKFTG